MCIVYMRIVYMCIAIDAKNRVLKYDIVGSGGDLVSTELAIYSDDLSLNAARVYNLFL